MRGFTVLELVVTISIFVIVTTITLANYPGYNDRLELELRAQDVALLTRQAQLFALGVRAATFGGPQVFKGFGVHYTTATPTSIIFFGDQDGGKDYDTGDGCGQASTECLEVYTLPANIVIDRLCGYTSPGGGIPCEFQPSALDIVFTRPNPDAVFTATPANDYALAEIELRSARSGVKKKVVVYTTGQISVQNAE